MTRIASLPREQWDPDLQKIDLTPMSETQRNILGVYAQAPALAKAFFAFEDAFWAGFTLRRRLLEMMRLRIAFHNQCRSCMAMRFEPALKDGLTEDLVCSLEQPYEAPDLTEAEKAALAFADRFATNHLTIDDAFMERMRQHYSEQEIVEISLLCGFCTGFGRFATVYAAVEALPESYRNLDERTAPWAKEHSERVIMPT